MIELVLAEQLTPGLEGEMKFNLAGRRTFADLAASLIDSTVVSAPGPRRALHLGVK